LVEGAIAAAISSSAGQSLDEVTGAAEETRGAKKL
jgi:dihydroxyacetone kinase DhaKLM complex PTS-EIIA-like component DhaM